jgi:hypothetical protein
MRILSISLALGMAVAAVAQTPAAPAGAIHAGPVYTRGDEAGSYPKYPDLQIQVEVPPGTGPDQVMPSAFQLKAAGASAVNATREQSLASTGYGMAVSVALDVSGSMAGRPLEAVKAGLIKFAGDAGPQDLISIQTIADESRWEVKFDDPHDKVRPALDGLAVRGSLTRLWDGLINAIRLFPSSPLSRHIIVISDGHDEGSSHSQDEVIAMAQKDGIVIDAIGITRSDRSFLLGLQRLTAETGGHFSEAHDTSALENLVGSGIEVLKNTPVVTFHLKDLPGDGKPHRFELIWRHDGTESRAELNAVVPLLPWAEPWMIWSGGGAVILIILIAVARRRRQGPGHTRLEVQPQPVPAPVEVSTPLPPRQVPGESAPGHMNRQRLPGLYQPPVAQPAAPERSKTEILARFPAPSKDKPAAWLVCEEGSAAGQKFPVDAVEYWIGALDNNHLKIADDPTVSGNHACLMFDHDVLGIYDYKSTNGTRVNGDLVGERRRLLRPGDLIKIGRSTFVLQPAATGEGVAS